MLPVAALWYKEKRPANNYLKFTQKNNKLMNNYYTFFVSIAIVLSMFACGGSAEKNKTHVAKDTLQKDTIPKTPVDTAGKPTTPAPATSAALSFEKVNKMIVNEWKVKAVLAPNGQTDARDDQQKKQMKQSSIVFNADGSQSMNVKLKKETVSEEGRWKLTDDGGEVVMISPTGKERRFKIEEISKDRLKLRTVLDQTGIVLEAKDAAPTGPVKKK